MQQKRLQESSIVSAAMASPSKDKDPFSLLHRLPDLHLHLQRLRQELICPICLSLFKQAASLSCTHSFCTACILQSMNSVTACPTCKLPATQREVRSTPRIDSLVSIYRSMESAAGIHLLSSQTVALNVAREQNQNGICEGISCHGPMKKKQCDYRETFSNITKDVSERHNRRKRVASSVVSVEQPYRGFTPASKRVQLPQPTLLIGGIGFQQGDVQEDAIKLETKERALSFYSKETCGKFDAKVVTNRSEKEQGQEASGTAVPASKENAQFLTSQSLRQTQNEDLELILIPENGRQNKDSPPLKEMTRIAVDALPVDGIGMSKLAPFLLRENSQDTKLIVPSAHFSQPSLHLSLSNLKDPDITHIKGHMEEFGKGVPSEFNNFGSDTFERTGPCSSELICSPSSKSFKQVSTGINVSVENMTMVGATVDDGSLLKAHMGLFRNGHHQFVQPMNKKQVHENDNFVDCHVTQIMTISNEFSSTEKSLNAGMTSEPTLDKGECAAVKSVQAQEVNQKTDAECQLEKSGPSKSDQDGFVSNKVDCAFCQTSGDSMVTGPMMHYKDGISIMEGRDSSGKLVNVHKLCAEWAPNVYFVDDVAKNLPKEVSRGQKIKCSSCGMKGAVLGCSLKRCRKSYHYPCARALSCRWDDDNFIILCPEHATSRFPNERASKSQSVVAYDQDPKINTEITAKVVPSSFTQVGTSLEKGSQKWPPGAASKWVLCGSGLNSKAKEQLASFVSHTGATLAKAWNSNVTHLIAGTDERGAARRTLKFLMATLDGKWILKVDWMTACRVAGQPVSEEPFEINIDIHGMLEGPKHGRSVAVAKAHKLFEGINFYFLGDYAAAYKADLQALIVAAGGVVLHRKPETTEAESLPNCTVVIYSKDLPPDVNMCNQEQIIKSRCLEAKSLASVVGAQVGAHTWILDSIAAYELQPFE